jgi:hypothetical protein
LKEFLSIMSITELKNGDLSDDDYYDIYSGPAAPVQWDRSGMSGYFKPGGGGFAYEDNVYVKLKEIGLVPRTFAPAGTANDLPDLILNVAPGKNPTQPKQIKVEVKLDDKADFGQSGLKWSTQKKWYLDGANTKESREMRKLLGAMGVPEKVNSVWGQHGPPRKFAATNGGTNKMSQRDIDYDREHFKDIMLTGTDAPSVQTLFRFYGAKKINYIQIGGHGLYYMNADPANLKSIGVNQFNGTLKLRIRRKAGGSRTQQYNYRFSTALMIDSPPGSTGLDLIENDSESLLQFLDPKSIVSDWYG